MLEYLRKHQEVARFYYITYLLNGSLFNYHNGLCREINACNHEPCSTVDSDECKEEETQLNTTTQFFTMTPAVLELSLKANQQKQP